MLFAVAFEEQAKGLFKVLFRDGTVATADGDGAEHPMRFAGTGVFGRLNTCPLVA